MALFVPRTPIAVQTWMEKVGDAIAMLNTIPWQGNVQIFPIFGGLRMSSATLHTLGER